MFKIIVTCKGCRKKFENWIRFLSMKNRREYCDECKNKKALENQRKQYIKVKDRKVAK